MPRFSANLSFLYPDRPFLDRFAAAAADGFTGVEYLFPYEYRAEEIAVRLLTHGLQQAMFNLPPGDWATGERGIACLPGRQAEFAAGVTQALRYAQVLDTRCLHVMAGIPKAGMSAAISTRDIPGYLLNRQDQAHAIVSAVGADNLKIQMDFYHLQIVEGDITMKYRQYQAEVGHVQIASVPERCEPDSGEVNYPYLFEMLDASGYDAWVGCEYRPRADTSAGLRWLRCWRERH